MHHTHTPSHSLPLMSPLYFSWMSFEPWLINLSNPSRYMVLDTAYSLNQYQPLLLIPVALLPNLYLFVSPMNNSSLRCIIRSSGRSEFDSSWSSWRGHAPHWALLTGQTTKKKKDIWSKCCLPSITSTTLLLLLSSTLSVVWDMSWPVIPRPRPV